MVERVNILGVGISSVHPQQALQLLNNWVQARERHYVCVCAVHTVMACQYDPELKGMVNHASLAVPDGMPLVWISRLAGQPHVARVYGPDLMLSFCALAAREGYRNYLLGGAPGQPEALADRLVTRFPGLKISGTRATPIRPLPDAENQAALDDINRSASDIVWVGMGTGFQERWVAENRARLDAPVLLGVGAAFDMHSDRFPQAPSWMQNMGMEWLFRLSREPRRLWRRYLIGNPHFVLKLTAQGLGLKRYTLDGDRD